MSSSVTLESQIFRLSPQQRRLWALSREAGNGEEGAAYRAVAEVRLSGRLDRQALEAALADVVERHEILRTAFPAPAGLGVPGQRILDEYRPRLELRDLSGLAPGEQDVAVGRIADDLAQILASHSVRLESEPPLAAALVVLAPARHALVIALHALLADEAALAVLTRDLRQAYAARIAGRERAEPPPVQYADVAAALGDLEESGEGRAYWREALPVVPSPRRLAFEREPEPGADGFAPRTVEAEVPPALLVRIDELAAACSVPRPIVFLAAWWALLVRLGPDEGEPSLGIELAGRQYEGFDGALGLFARTVPLRGVAAGALRFSDRVAGLAEEVAAAEEWQDSFSWEAWAGGPSDASSFFSAVFRLAEEDEEESEVAGLSFSLAGRRSITERFRLRLGVRRRGQSLSLELAYDSACFSQAEARTLLVSFLALVADAVERPRAPVADLETVGREERQRLLAELDAGRRGFATATVQRLFAEQARSTPEAIAVSIADPALGEAVTYGELARRVSRLATRLRQAGAGPDVPVAILAERSPVLIAGILAILEAGSAYVPLDPEYPPARLALALQGSRAPILLAQTGLRGILPGPLPAQLIGLEESLRDKAAASRPVSDPEPDGENAAYILFTSGSTATPKGVVVRHRALANQMLWLQEAHPLEAGDRVLQKTPLGFDASVWELLGPLLAGAELVLADPGAHREPARLARITLESGTTVLQVVPSLLPLLLAEPAFLACAALRRLCCGGEPLPAELRDRFQALLPGERELVNLYGPTETTVQVTSWVETGRAAPAAPGETVPIGRPIANARLYLFDREMRLVPPGLPGEIWIGGEPLARGYLGRPELTAAAFLPDPFTEEAGARMYRTGDLGRRRGDGALEYLGRLGRQIKIRGYRFDPGEIEDLLVRLPAVKEAAVEVREDAAGDLRLVAYVAVQQDGFDALALRAHLASQLPDFLVPGAFMLLATLPRTPGGKLDRNALPSPSAVAAEADRAADDFAPCTAIEEVLAAIWADLLGRERIGNHEDFFALGGHSLLGAQLVARIRQAFGVEISLRTLFEAPTVAGLAEQVSMAKGPPAPALVPVAEAGDRPLSFAQRRLWFLDRLEPGNPSYNVLSAVLFRGRLDAGALLAAFREIVRVQEGLRTSFPLLGSEPVQRVAPALALDLPVVDLSALPEERRLPAAIGLAREAALRPFDLACGPLLRLALLRLGLDARGGERNVLLTGLHHIVSDAWSIGILYRDLMALYAAAVAGAPVSLAAPPVQYGDYAVWQRRWFAQRRDTELAYWRRQLAELPTLRLPGDRPRPARQSSQGGALPWAVAAPLAESLRRLARAEVATPFMLLLATFQALLHRHVDREPDDDDIVVGSPVANRERAEVEGLVGFFVNTLVLRTSLAGRPTARELVARVREVALGAYAHQAMPFEVLVEELEPEGKTGPQGSPGHQPLFQVMFHLQNAPLPRFSLPGVEVEPLEIDSEIAPFDLGVDLLETAEGLLGVTRYAADLFDAATVQRLLAHWSALLAGVAADPGRRLGEIPLLAEAERHQLAVEWNDTVAELGTDAEAPIHRLVEQRAAERPEAIAVAFGEETLTYGELERRAGHLSRCLRSLGVGPGVPVGACLDRSLDLPVALLGIWKAGGAFVPLDPASPRARLALMAEDALGRDERSVLVTHRGLASGLPTAGARILDLDAGSRAPAGISLLPASPEELPRLGDAAYILYTSGTSGRPKGVVVEHGSLSNLLRLAAPEPGRDVTDRMACHASYGFDIFFFELLTPLLAGGTAVLLPAELDLERLLATLPDLTRFQAVPPLMREIVDRLRGSAADGLPSLPRPRVVYTGAERVPDSLLADLRAVFPEAALWVLYGPTEGTVFCTSYPVPEGPTPRSRIGRPVANARVTLRDGEGGLAPLGVAGEIVLAGAAVARGYLGGEEPTEAGRARFAEVEGGRIYRTGDRARLLADGNLEFLGRIDGQVKVRGVRIETAEVEAALAAHPAVRQAAVLALTEADGPMRLVAFTVSGGAAPAAAALRAFLRERLPGPMIPAAFVALPALPVTAHGKLDRAALARVAAEAAPAQAVEGFTPPSGPVEELVAAIWAEILGVERVGRDDNFFDLSGHSLLATQAAHRMERALGVAVPLRRFFERATVAELASELARARTAGAAEGEPTPPLERAPRDRPIPASFYQEWGWRMQGGPVSDDFKLPHALRLRGRLDVIALQADVDEVVRRHEVLRTSLQPDPAAGGDALLQVISPPAEVLPLPLPVADLSGLPVALQEEQLAAVLRAHLTRPHDLRRAPLLRLLLVRLGAADHALALDQPHVSGDGWSLDLLQRELAALYAAFAAGRPSPLPPPAWQHTDFAYWQRHALEGGPVEAQIAWWRRHLAGVPPPADLPARRPRPARPGRDAATWHWTLPPDLDAGLRSLARAEGATLAMALLAGLAALMHRYTGRESLLIASILAGRSRPEFAGVLGLLMNTVPVRVDFPAGQEFGQLLAQVRENVLAAHAHQDVSFPRLFAALCPGGGVDRSALVRVGFNLLSIPSSPAGLAEPPALAVEEIPCGNVAVYELALACREQDGLHCELTASADVLAVDEVEAMARDLQALLSQVTAEPTVPLDRLLPSLYHRAAAGHGAEAASES